MGDCDIFLQCVAEKGHFMVALHFFYCHSLITLQYIIIHYNIYISLLLTSWTNQTASS